MSFELQLRNELTAFVAAIVDTIPDRELKSIVARILTAEVLARLAIDSIQLGLYEDPEYEAVDLEMWEALAQPVRSALISLHELKDVLTEFVPPPASGSDDVTIDFDLTDDAAVEPVKDATARKVDDLIAGAKQQGEAAAAKTIEERRAQARAALAPMADILLHELLRFGVRLRNPHIVADRWNLLADLQEFRGKFKKLLGALRFGVLHAFSELPDQALLIDYRTELYAALALRHAFSSLARDVQSLAAAYTRGSQDERRSVLEELLLRLQRFSKSEAFQLMRAPDKRALIEFRKGLSSKLSEAAASERELGRMVDGLLRFLEAMGAINRREVLMRHDQPLAQALTVQVTALQELLGSDLEAAGAQLLELRTSAEALIGRDPMLDVFLVAPFEATERDDLAVVCVWLGRALARIRS